MDLDIVYKGNWNADTRLPSGIYYTDASGGEDHDSPELRRCGVGICSSPKVDPHEAPGGLCYPLPGEVQTVPRGELHAILTVVSLAQPGAEIHIYSDNKQAVKMCQGQGAPKPLNNDLLCALNKLVTTKRLTLKVEWIKSHLPLWHPQDWPPGVTKHQVFGNHYADAYAGDAALRHRLPADISAPVRQAMHLVRRIQLRLATILCQLPKRTKAEAKPAQPSPRPPPLYTLFDASPHIVFQVENRLCCLFCKASVPTRQRTEAKEWLNTHCRCTVLKIGGNKYTHYT